MFIVIIQQTQLYMACVFGLFNTNTCFGCPDQPWSGRA